MNTTDLYRAGSCRDSYTATTIPRWMTSAATVILATTIFLLAASAAAAQHPGLKISVTPAAIYPTGGKLPANLSIGVTDVSCTGKSAMVKISVVGAGVELTEQKAGNCSVIGKLKIDDSASPGIYEVFALDKDEKPIGSQDISIMDNSAGPIAPGLSAQVDVMWNVLSQKNCSDAYGKRVAGRLYCVEVKLGNNSGHPIQIAGVGFSRKLPSIAQNIILANTSYSTTRAVLLRERALSFRSLAYNGIQAFGLLFGGFAPFLVNANHKAHFATADSIIGDNLLQAFSIFSPDRIVGQLNNLDDTALRDNITILNNQHKATVIFVDKRSVTEAITAAQLELNGVLEDYKANHPDRKDSRDVKIASEMMKQVEADTVKTAKNSRQPLFGGGDFSPILVKLALGDLVIVGDQIEFLQRVQIQSAATTTAASKLALSTPADGTQVEAGAGFQFKASSDDVVWKVNDIENGNAEFGTVDAKGLYAAPLHLPGKNPFNITACLKDGSQCASSAVTIVPLLAHLELVSVSDNADKIEAGATAPVTFTVSGRTNLGTRWSINGFPAGTAEKDLGQITGDNAKGEYQYMPPPKVTTTVNVVLIGTSEVDRNSHVIVRITVVPKPVK